MSSIVLTGASGFLGRHVLQELRRAGETPRALVGPRSTPSSGVTVVDVTDPKSIEPAIAGATCVIHCAGLAHQFGPLSDDAFTAVNERGTENVIAAAARAGAERFVLASSVSVYGSGANPNEETQCAPRTPYARSKLAAEHAAERIATSAGMSLVILRLATLYGPRDPGNIRRLVEAIDKRRFVWLGDGSNRKSLLYVTDAARACAAAAGPGAPSGIYNVVGQTVTVREIVDEIGRELHRVLPRYHIPATIVRVAASAASLVPVGAARRAADTATKWLRDDVYDGVKFSRAFAFAPSVLLGEGIAAEVAAMREGQRS